MSEKYKCPLLSICIPTYNRGYILREVLEKYVNDSEFDDDVEIVISDNCSTDDTEIVCREYANHYENINYYRNKENIRDANFYTVLDYGSGEYLKLINDWSYYDKDALRFVKTKIKEWKNDKKAIFFSNDTLFTKKKADVVECNNLDEYVQTVSTWVTSNNLFGVWREQWPKIRNREKYTELKLQQVDWTYQIVQASKGCVIYNRKVLSTAKIKRKVLTGYNWFEIHIHNYYTIMQPYTQKGIISERTIKDDKRYLLEHFKREFCLTYFYNYTKVWRFETEGTSKILRNYYSEDPYVFYFFAKLPFVYFQMLFNDLKKKLVKLI